MGFLSPHHCVGFLFFAWIPPGGSRLRRLRRFPSLTTPHSPLFTTPLYHISLIIHHSTFTTQHSPLYASHLSHLTHHSPLFTTTLITSHSSFTTLHYTTYHISLIIPHSTHLTYHISLILHHSTHLTYHISLIIHHSSLHHLSHLTHHSGAVRRASWSNCGAHGRRWAAAAFRRVADAVHRASLEELRARVGAAGPQLASRVAGAVHRASMEELLRAWAPLGRGSLSCGKHSTQSLLEELRRAWAPLGCGSFVAQVAEELSWRSCVRAWAPLGRSWLSCGRRMQTQHTEPYGGAAARVAAGPRLALMWQTQCTERPGGCERAWAPLGRGWLLVWQVAVHRAFLEELRARVGAAGPRLPFVWQTQYREPSGGAVARVWRRWAAAGFRVAGAVHRAFWRSCGARGRRWAAAAFRVAGAAHRAWPPLGSELPFVRQAQYTEPPGGAAARVAAAAFRVAGAVHRASWRSCGARGRRWAAAAFRVAGAVHRASWRSCGARGRRWAAAGFRMAKVQYTEPPWRSCGARGRRWARWLLSYGTRRASIFDTLIFLTPLCHTNFDTPSIFHTPSFTHNFVTHHLSHTIFDTPPLTHHLSHHFVPHHLSHTTLSHTIFAHTIFDTHHLSHTLCHTPSLTHTIFVTHHL